MQRFTPEINRVYLFSPREDGKETGLIAKQFPEYEHTRSNIFMASSVARYGMWTKKACLVFISDSSNEKEAEKFLKSINKKLKKADTEQLSDRRPFSTDFIFEG